ncbi:MAG: hypothetical protein LBM93_13785 [Oscillospiraceae bacterium]|jgi:hypothetical protein|nr:hypothetical protein [Oscillospiraceae bacterium]
MFIKLGLKEFKKNIFMNILIIIQMAIIFAISISIVSSVVSRYKYYTPFSDYLKTNGLVSFFGIPRTEDDLGPIVYGDGEFTKNLKGVKRFTTAYCIYFLDKKYYDFLAYDNEVIERYTPELESGKWLNETDFRDGYLPIVISQNGGEYKVGDIMDVPVSLIDPRKIAEQDWENAGSETSIKCKVIGILKENTPVYAVTDIIDYSNTTSKKISSRQLFGAFSYEFEQKILIISPLDWFNKHNSENILQMQPMMTGPVLVEFDNNLTKEEIENNITI